MTLICQSSPNGGTTTTRAGDGEITDKHHRNVLRDILSGCALGAGLGVAPLAIPGAGALAAAGATAASAVPETVGITRSDSGFLNEVLTKHGVSKEDANYYGGGLKNGAVLLQWRTPDQTRKRATTACPNDE